MNGLLTLSGTEKKPEVSLCAEALQRMVDGRGSNAIASSLNLSAREISEIYDYRDVSEMQFSVLKPQFALNETRVPDGPRIEARLAVGFIAAIIRAEIDLACRKLGLDTDKVLGEAARTVLTLMPNERHSAAHDFPTPTRVNGLHLQFGLKDGYLDFLSREANNRRNPTSSQTRAMPPFVEPGSTRGRGRPPKPVTVETEEAPKRKPGRPMGGKNKKTLEREAQAAAARRGGGRPKGSKNKKTIERERLAAAKQPPSPQSKMFEAGRRRI